MSERLKRETREGRIRPDTEKKAGLDEGDAS
jgi:hypothetical protein